MFYVAYIYLRVFMLIATSAMDGETQAIMTVLHCLLDSISKASFRSRVNLESLGRGQIRRDFIR